MESYKEFAVIYDELMNDIDYNEWFSYIEEILEKNNVSSKKILEMACGTGNLTKLFCDEMYDVTCFDLSSDMLTVAYDKLKKYRNVKVLNMDMVDFKLNDSFETVISICDSINYITEENDIEKVFKNVYNVLKDDGVFIFDINSFYKLSSIIGDNTFVYENEKVFYTWQNHFDNEEKIAEFYLTFFIKDNDKYVRVDEEHYERAYSTQEIVCALKKVGFNDICIYDAFTFNPPKKDSERINFVVRK